MASRKTNTMSEVLDSLYTTITEAKTVMDADMPFLVQLETQILQKLRDPQRIMQEQGLLPPDQAGVAPQDQGMPPGPGGGPPQGGGGPSFMPPGGGDSAAAGLRGMTPGVAAPNMDEMRRMLR